jgi:hypothetical protein
MLSTLLANSVSTEISLGNGMTVRPSASVFSTYHSISALSEFHE